MSRGRCGRRIARLRRLAAVVAASFLRFFLANHAAIIASGQLAILAAGEAKNHAISAAEWLRAHLRPPWSVRFCDAIFVPLGSREVRGTAEIAEREHSGRSSGKSLGR